MQYKCMEKEIRKLHGGFYVPICHVCREYSGRNAALAAGKSRIPVYRLLIFPSRSPGAGKTKRILQIRKKYDNPSQKHGYHPLQHEPAFPDDKSRVDAGFSCGLALPPDFREALINSQSLPL